MKPLYFLLIMGIAGAFFSCGNASSKQAKKATQVSGKAEPKTPLLELSGMVLDEGMDAWIVDRETIAQDSLVVTIDNYNCALLKSPGVHEIKDMMKEYGEEEFFHIAEDNSAYVKTASMYLDSLNIKTIPVGEKPYVYLKSRMHKSIYIDLRKMPQAWEVLLYNPNKGLTVAPEDKAACRTFFED